MSSVLRLWQLISPTLPIGAYAYSAGLETACEAGWVADEAQAKDWIAGQLSHSLAVLDVPLLARLYAAWQASDAAAVDYWNSYLQACRETAELLAEDRHMGMALAKLLGDLGLESAVIWFERGDASFATSFSLAAVHWNIPLQEAAAGYLWAWCENQVAAAVKLVPLGQTAGQRLLLSLAAAIPAAVDHGLSLEDPEDIGAACPGVIHASMRHETQYSRLFRS
jgi:urease accessory protein